MAIKYADRLAWAQEQFENNLIILEATLANLREFSEKRNPHQDDEDDALMAAADCLRFADCQVQSAFDVLEEGC